MGPQWALDVGIAPEAALARLGGAINQRPKRAFGVLKVQKEFVGAIASEHFEIWERSQRAVHGVGRFSAVSGGTRVEMRFLVPPITKALIVVFFALYAVAAGGFVLGARDATVALANVIFGVGGAVILAILFTSAARRQRADLGAFLERLFGDVPRV
ncbi:MAG TPA: hypothetical protein VJ726_02610 [Candidatus Limnocylindria bacterium]|nr:hypothetical protein [Candidatus Limnocylindria bacterium]